MSNLSFQHRLKQVHIDFTSKSHWNNIYITLKSQRDAGGAHWTHQTRWTHWDIKHWTYHISHHRSLTITIAITIAITYHSLTQSQSHTTHNHNRYHISLTVTIYTLQITYHSLSLHQCVFTRTGTQNDKRVRDARLAPVHWTKSHSIFNNHIKHWTYTNGKSVDKPLTNTMELRIWMNVYVSICLCLSLSVSILFIIRHATCNQSKIINVGDLSCCARSWGASASCSLWAVSDLV
jgi:hypothetical protein